MDKKLIRKVNALLPNQFNAQPGRMHGLIIIFEGKNASGQTADYEDLGNMVVRRNGRQLVNVDYKSLAEITDTRFGSNLFSSTVASDFIASCFVPFFVSEEFPNALEILGDDELNIEHQPSATGSAKFDNLTISVYSELVELNEAYEYYITRNNIQENGAVSGTPYQQNLKNITELYIGDSASIIDLIQVDATRLGVQGSIVTGQSFNALKVSTLKDNKIEDPTRVEYACVRFFTPGNPNTLVNRNTEVTLTTSGAGTVKVIRCSILKTA